MDDQIFKGPDGNTALRFFYQPSINNFQTEKHGRAIYDNSLLVEVMVPGMRESTPQFEVERTLCEEAGVDANGNRIVKRGSKYDEYREAIEAFKRNNGDGVLDGTPLSGWPQIDPGTVATYKAAGVFTVEQLAAVSDGNLDRLGIGGRRMREMAQAFLNTRTFGMPSAQMASENSSLREQLAFANKRIEELENALRSQPVAAAAPAPAATPAAPPPPPAPVADPFAAPATPQIDLTSDLDNDPPDAPLI